jgi:hypothetical protein
MNSDNPYETPGEIASAGAPSRRSSKTLGTTLLLIGLAILVYGAIAFWLINSLPPNGGGKGRLPSLYVMGMGIVITLLGLAVRGLRGGKKGLADKTGKGIRTSHGVLILIATVIVFILIFSQL